MHLKDYYAILQVEPSATQAEIKKAFRKLAQQYHPDKNNSDPYSVALFAEIKEAYEVLINPLKKEYYLQQRWYQQSTGRRKTGSIITPVTVLKQTLELDRHVSRLDVHRMDKQGLTEYILSIVSDTAIQQLKTFNEPETVKQIIMMLVKTSSFLSSEHTAAVSLQLNKLSDDDGTREYISAAFQQYQKKEKLEKYQPFILAAAAVVICLIIWLLSR